MDHCFFSGADLIFEELSDATHWRGWQEKTYGQKLSICGENAKKFADFTLRNYPERGKPYVPVALMLENDHGWNPPYPLWGYYGGVWGNKVPYQASDRSIEAFFNFTFPGYSEAVFCCDKNVNSEIPWTSKREYVDLLLKGYDIRSIEKGNLVPSTFGDLFDVILESCPLNLLKQYRAIILLGGIKLSPVLKKKLISYVKDGGVVVINSKQLGPEDEKFVGVKIVAPHREYRGGYVKCSVCGHKISEGRFYYVQVKKAGSKVISYFDNGEPLITSRKLGRGRIIFTTPKHLLSFKNCELLESGKHFFSHLMKEFSFVKMQGPPIQYHINLIDKGILILLINNSIKTWKGEINVAGQRASRVEDIWNRKKVLAENINGETKWSATIKPFDFSIYRIVP